MTAYCSQRYFCSLFYLKFRNAVNIATVAAFFTYIGSGLDGTAGLGDFNLALDDSYNGQIVKGCPAYDDVRQPSMDNFDVKKYQGLWYEHKFHDWTQFKEVYDTTLDIRVRIFSLFSCASSLLKQKPKLN